MSTTVKDRVIQTLAVMQDLMGGERPTDQGYVGFFGRTIQAMRFEHNCKISSLFCRAGSFYRVEFNLTTLPGSTPSETLLAAGVLAEFQGRLPEFTVEETDEVVQALEQMYGKR